MGFDVRRSPFDDPRVRRALALATDREKLVDVALRGHVFPATGGFVPPGMPGHSPGIGLPYDPDRARQLLAEDGYPGGRGFPAVEALIPSGYVPTCEYLQVQWREDLGVEITWQILEWAMFIDRLVREPPQIFIVGFRGGLDPVGFLDDYFEEFVSGWQNQAYTELLERARRVMDQVERTKLYAQADRILVEEAPVVPLYYLRTHWLVKPWVSKFPLFDTDPAHFWKDVIIEPH